MGARANKEPLPGESMPQTSLCTVISLAQTELLIPQVIIKGPGILPGLQAGREAQPEALEVAQEVAGILGRGGSVVPIPWADSQAEAQPEGCLGIPWEGENEGAQGHRTSPATSVAEGKTTGRQREGQSRKEGEGFLALPSSRFPRGEWEGSWDAQFPLPGCKAALPHSISPWSPHFPRHVGNS